MKLLLRTNEPVLISYLTAVLRDAGIFHDVFDENISLVEGQIGVFPRRVMVEDDRLDEAQALLEEVQAGLAEPLDEDALAIAGDIAVAPGMTSAGPDAPNAAPANEGHPRADSGSEQIGAPWKLA